MQHVKDWEYIEESKLESSWEERYDYMTNPNNFEKGRYDALLGEHLFDKTSYPESEYELDVDKIKVFISKVEKEAYERGAGDERQFILNVLDGVDIADKTMGNEGGTLAIRHALKSRIIKST